jgi:hypothetical protein
LELKTGMMVEFTPLKIEGKGYRAVHVRVVERPVTNDRTDTSEVSILPER